MKKVYSIISLQLTVTVATVWLTFNSRAFLRFQANNDWTFWLAIIGSLVTMLALFFGNISRKAPTNYIVMGLFTLFESYLVSFVCYLYTPESALLAASATLAATVGLTYYAMTTREDMTSWRFVGKGIFSSLLWIVFSVSLINLLFLRSGLVSTGIAALFAVIYSVYLLIDTQLVLGGRHKQLQLDDYILGATIIYVDIISLFLKLLRLLGKKKND